MTQYTCADIVHDVMNTHCHTQNGGVHGRIFSFIRRLNIYKYYSAELANRLTECRCFNKKYIRSLYSRLLDVVRTMSVQIEKHTLHRRKGKQI